MELCFNRIRRDLRMPRENLHFPGVNPKAYVESWRHARCVVMQGGQGEVKHWAFNDPPKAGGKYADSPPPPEESGSSEHAWWICTRSRSSRTREPPAGASSERSEPGYQRGAARDLEG